jgi:hypothetical protein
VRGYAFQIEDNAEVLDSWIDEDPLFKKENTTGEALGRGTITRKQGEYVLVF